MIYAPLILLTLVAAVLLAGVAHLVYSDWKAGR